MSAQVNYTPNTAPTELAPIVSIVRTNTGRQTFTSGIGGQRKTYVYEPRCHVCTSEQEVLDEIHLMAANGTPVARMAKMVAPEAKLSARQIKHHLVTHVSEYALYERAIASAAVAFGEGDTPSRVSGMHSSQIILERGTALLSQGRMQLKASDIIAAARFQHDMEVEVKEMADASVYSTAMMIILGKFYEAIGPSRFNAVMWSLGSDPRMAQIMRDTGLSPAAAIQQEINESPVSKLLVSM